MQEWEWAVGQIRRLRSDVGRLSRKREAARIETDMEHADGLDPKLNAQRLLQLKEVSTMIGLKHSAIYKYVAEGRFPTPIKVGERNVRWKLSDVLAWQNRARFDETHQM
jgi:prophage regulatory protein